MGKGKMDKAEKPKKCNGCRDPFDTQEELDDHIEDTPLCKDIIQGKYRVKGGVDRRYKLAGIKEANAKAKQEAALSQENKKKNKKKNGAADSQQKKNKKKQGKH